MSSTLSNPMCDLCSCVFDTVMKPLELSRLAERRAALLAEAGGRVLEVGAGTGANLRHYRYEAIEELVLSDLELRPVLARRAERTVKEVGSADTTVRLIPASAERLPFADESFDCVVTTLVFCSVPDQETGLGELYRVLRPGGRVLFLEHVRPRHAMLARVFEALNPAWRFISGGCSLTRDTLLAFRRAGFASDEPERFGKGVFVCGTAFKPRPRR